MKKTLFIGAGSDLGVTIDGASLGALTILDKIKSEKIIFKQKANIKKSHDDKDLKKNLKEVNNFNQELYNFLVTDNHFPITIGGDHSIAIASGLASLKKNKNLGLIWIDSHLDYNTFTTTITGNLHGLPLATLNGLNQDLSLFHEGNYFDPKKTVVIGYRAFESNAKEEISNIKTMGVTVFTTNDIKESGAQSIMEMAYKIANQDNQGVHVSFDLDVIDPEIAPGVSVKEKNGLNLQEIGTILEYIKYHDDSLKSFDLVEYNPLNDINNQTLNIALNILKKLTKE